MTLMSHRERLIAKAHNSDTEEKDLLYAALAEMMDRQQRQHEEYRKFTEETFQSLQERISALESSVRASNGKVKVDVSETLENQAEEITGKITARFEGRVDKWAGKLDRVASISSKHQWIIVGVILIMTVVLGATAGYLKLLTDHVNKVETDVSRIRWNTSYPDSRVGLYEDGDEFTKQYQDQYDYEENQRRQQKQK